MTMNIIDYQLGRMAYEAYCETTEWKSAITGASLPSFADASEMVQIGWIAAARAVANACWELTHGA